MTPINEKNYRAAKSNVVLMERSTAVGHLSLHGNDHVDLLHRMTTNELRNLSPGEGQINVFANEVGRIVDRVHLLKKEDSIHLIASAGNGERLAGWINKFIFLEDVKVGQPESAMLSVFGPNSPELLQKTFSGVELPGAADFTETDFEGVSVMVVCTPELATPGFNLIAPADLLVKLGTVLSTAGEEKVEYISEETYEILRIEAGWPLFSRDFDENINPHEAGMLPYLNFDKGCYIGQEVIARLDTYEKVKKRLTGIIIKNGRLPEHGDTLKIDGENGGQISSAVYSFDFGNIALAFVKSKFLNSKEVEIITADKEINGTLCSLPFMKGSDDPA